MKIKSIKGLQHQVNNKKGQKELTSNQLNKIVGGQRIKIGDDPDDEVEFVEISILDVT